MWRVDIHQPPPLSRPTPTRVQTIKHKEENSRTKIRRLKLREKLDDKRRGLRQTTLNYHRKDTEICGKLSEAIKTPDHTERGKICGQDLEHDGTRPDHINSTHDY